MLWINDLGWMESLSMTVETWRSDDRELQVISTSAELGRIPHDCTTILSPYLKPRSRD